MPIRGVRVDRCMQTDRSGIYAAGDVCQGKIFPPAPAPYRPSSPLRRSRSRGGLEHVRPATGLAHQGCINMNVLDTVGLISTSYGTWMVSEGGDDVALCNTERFRYLNL